MTDSPPESADQTSPKKERVCFFQFEQEVRAFDRAVGEVVRRLVQADQPLAPKNIHRLTHGSTWDHPAADSAMAGAMQRHSVETEFSLADLRDGKFEILPAMISEVVEGLKRHFYQTLYATVSEGAERVGNVVSAEEAGSFAAGFLETLKRIEFGVDESGNVSMPEVHVGPGVFEKIKAELDAQPREYQEEIERVKEKKTAEALQKERRRRGKFLRYRR